MQSVQAKLGSASQQSNSVSTLPEQELERYFPGSKEYKWAKQRAHYAVKQAIAYGWLGDLKEKHIICVDCKSKRALTWEHRDYEEQLKVEAVCYSCNKRRGHALGPRPGIQAPRRSTRCW